MSSYMAVLGGEKVERWKGENDEMSRGRHAKTFLCCFMMVTR